MRRLACFFQRRLLLLGLALGSVWPRVELEAQIIQGIVLDDTGTGPLAGAMVVVMELDGTVAGRGLTGAEGRFEIRVPHPGRYQARVDRIGYESITTRAFDTPPDGTYQRILVPIRAVELEGLDVSGAKRCEVRPDVGQVTARVWEEARKALEAARWTSESSRFDYTLLQFSRLWDAGGKDLRDETREFLERRGEAPYRSVSAEDLASRGFVREIFTDLLSYDAPDAGVLLSDAFLDTHCMRARRASSGMVALDFEPVNGRDVPEIKGTMWLDAATAELQRVEYLYVNLDRGRATGEAGGELEFIRSADGTWFVADWRVRMPLLEPGRTVGYRRTGYEDKGGVVWRARDTSGTQVYQAVTARIAGLVLDSLGAPLPGVVLVPRGIPTRAESDALGAFVLDGLPEGLVRLDVAAPHLDTLGLTAFDTALASVLPKGGSKEIELQVPGVGDRMESFCDAERRDETSILLGRVRVSGGSPEGMAVRFSRVSGSGRLRLQERATPPGGGVQSRWQHLGDTPWWEATLDARGLFMLCNIPNPSVVRVVVGTEGQAAEADVTLETGASVVVVTLSVAPSGERH